MALATWGCGAKQGAPTVVATGEVTPAGGQVASVVGGTGPILTVPEGAVSQPVTIIISVSPTPPPDGSITPTYVFDPPGTTFTQPVTVSIPVPAGTTDGTIYWTQAGSTDQYEPIGTVIANGMAQGQVIHLGMGHVGRPCHDGASCRTGVDCRAGRSDCSTGEPVCRDQGPAPDGAACGVSGSACVAGACQALPAGTGYVSTTGGTVSLPSGPSVAVPPGAVTQPIPITVEPSPTAPPDGAVSPVFAFGPDGTTFAVPVTVSIPVADGTTEASIYWTLPGSTTEYEALPAVVAGNLAVTQVTHFSRGFAGRPCVRGGACVPSNPCRVGVQECSRGTPTCADGGADLPDGTVCATGSVCTAGACTPVPTAHAVGGTVSGLVGSGLVLRNNGGNDLGVAGNGPFTFTASVQDGSPYAVTVASQPVNPAQTCAVANGTGTMNGADVRGVTVACVTNAYTVGGTVSGLAGTGLVLRNAGGDPLPVTANGTFAFPTPVASGSAYLVTVASQPVGPVQTCTVANGAGAVVAGNVSNVAVTCTTNTYTVGGTVTGLAGTGLALRDGAGTPLAVVANGTFTFPAPVASGATYAVTVATQPTGPAQTCTVTNGTGTMGAASVTSVAVACVTNAFTVGGTVTGLVGTGLVLRNNGGNALAVGANGSFTFTTPVASGAAYAVTVGAQPTGTAQTCTVTNGTGTVGAANVTSVAVACTTNTYAVGGTVSGLAGTGLVLRNNGGDALAVGATGAFSFTTPVASGGAYAVTVATQPAGPSQTCTVTNGAGTVGAVDVTGVVVTCVTNTYTVGGTVSGLAGAGLVLRNNGGNPLAIAGNGTFTFTTAVTSGAAYAVTVATQPTGPSQTCTVTNGAGTVGGAAVANVAVACTTNTYTVGGTVSGLAGAGLVLRNNGGNPLPVGANGTFTFTTAVASGAAYAVTVATQPTGPTQVCTVTSGSGTVGGANVTGVAVSCVTSTYTVGGTVAGLSGTGLVLRNNGGDALPVNANGGFAFATPVASGGAYAVTVATQPTGPSQTCAVSFGSGTVGSGNVTTVAIACTTNTYTVGGTVTGLSGSGLLLSNNGGDPLPVSASGAFTFATPVASGGVYGVTVATQPTGPSQTCTVTGGTGTVYAANVTNVAVACTTNTYAVGGTVSGLQGTGLALRNNGGNPLPITADGVFVFGAAVASGAPYEVTVATQPSGPVQACVVGNGSGTVAAAPVTSVSVSCASSFTFTGTRRKVYWPDAGPVYQNLDGQTVSVLSGPMTNPTETSATVSGGSFSIPGVPAGRRWVKVQGAGYIETDATSLDLDVDYPGRESQGPPSGYTPVTLTFTGLTPWTTGLDQIECVSSNAADVGYLYGPYGPGGDPIPAGSTSYSGLKNWPEAGYRIDASLGDVTYFHQLAARTVVAGGVTYPYHAAERAYYTSAFTVPDVTPSSFTVPLAPIARTSTVAIDWRGSEFAAHLADLDPRGNAPAPFVAVEGSYQPPGAGNRWGGAWGGGWPDLLAVNDLPPSSDVNLGVLAFGDFLPSPWAKFRMVRYTVPIYFRASGAATSRSIAAAMEVDDELSAATGPIVPRITPVRNVLVNGASPTFGLTSVGPTPLVTWDEPAIFPAGSYYTLGIQRIYATAAGGTAAQAVTSFTTTSRSVQVPPGLLSDGNEYVLLVWAISTPGKPMESFRTTMPYSSANYVSGVVTTSTTRTVSGSVIDSYWADAGTTTVPRAGVALTLTYGTVELPVMLSTTTATDGTFSFPGVPWGFYRLQYRRSAGSPWSVLDINGTTLDLGTDILGRATQARPTLSTPVTMDFTGLAPWTANSDQLELISSNAGAVGYLMGSWFGGELAAGATSASFVDDLLYDTSTLIDASQGDVTYFHQLANRSVAAGGVTYPYASAERYHSTNAFTTANGGASSVSVPLQPVPRHVSTDVTWQGSQFAPYTADLVPVPGTPSGQIAVGASGRGPGSPYLASTYGGWPDMMSFQFGGAGSDIHFGAVEYGSFLPAPWAEFGAISYAVPMSYTAAGASAPMIRYARIDRSEFVDSWQGTLTVAPVVSPVRNVTVNGQPAFGTLSGVGLTPTVAWTAPALIPGRLSYQVTVNRVYAGGVGQTLSQAIAYLKTASTSVRVPDGILQAGQQYYLVVNVYYTPGFAPWRPARVQLPYYTATVFTSLLTP